MTTLLRRSFSAILRKAARFDHPAPNAFLRYTEKWVPFCQGVFIKHLNIRPRETENFYGLPAFFTIRRRGRGFFRVFSKKLLNIRPRGRGKIRWFSKFSETALLPYGEMQAILSGCSPIYGEIHAVLLTCFSKKLCFSDIHSREAEKDSRFSRKSPEKQKLPPQIGHSRFFHRIVIYYFQ